jgi:RHS repeat-associated protein
MLNNRQISRICRKGHKVAQKSDMSYLHVNYSDEDGTLIAQTLAGGASTTWGQSAKYVHLPTASGPMPVAAIYGTKHYAVQSDHLNTPRRLIQSDGQVAWQWAYSAFGDEQPTIASNRFANTALSQSFGSTTVPAVTFNLRYPGQYFDQESNLHYNYHRSYSATVGRYTQSDPIGLDGGWNRYGYVGGNPLSFTDPLGLASVTRPSEGNRLDGGGGGGSIGGGAAGAGGAGVGLGLGSIIDAVIKFCTPDDPCKRLNDDVQRAKDEVGKFKPAACSIGMSRWDLQQRQNAWLNEAVARAKRDQICWAGGDAGHQTAQASAWSHVGQCARLLN